MHSYHTLRFVYDIRSCLPFRTSNYIKSTFITIQQRSVKVGKVFVNFITDHRLYNEESILMIKEFLECIFKSF